jgi:hypothetical protein
LRGCFPYKLLHGRKKKRKKNFKVNQLKLITAVLMGKRDSETIEKQQEMKKYK